MPRILSFRDLEVWQLAMQLVVNVYRASERLPPAERFGLTSQMRRSAVSIPSNIAEGHARRNDSVYLNHLKIALGSQAELSTQIEVALRLGFFKAEVTASLLDEIDHVRRMLHGLRGSLERRQQALLGSTILGVLLFSTGLLS
ncbi:MAG TPA: four helix bundle protein [Vicinamibacterales bacterium]